MLKTVEATIDEHGKVTANEATVLAESALADWNRPEEDDAWKHLADLPDLDKEAQ